MQFHRKATSSSEAVKLRIDDDFDAEIDKPTSFESGSEEKIHEPWLKKGGNNGYGKLLREKELSRPFYENYEAIMKRKLDPRGPHINRWNKVFLVACLISLFVDPLVFYLRGVKEGKEGVCIDTNQSLEIALTIMRSTVDAFYMIKIFVGFRTGFVVPSSRVFGRGELVIEPSKIAARYLRKDFWFDLVAAMPLPQVMIWGLIPNLCSLTTIIIILQYLLRLYLIYPLLLQIVKATGMVTETAWAGAAYNLMLYMLASHVLGACWYLLSMERQEECWRQVCLHHDLHCFLNCRTLKYADRAAMSKSSNISLLCDPNSSFFQFGIYAEALTVRVASLNFYNKICYCLWWGLRNLSSLGQALMTSTSIGEIHFAIITAILGLVLLALLVGNIQAYLQSISVRLEEWRIKRADTEQWMHHRQLPHELRQSVRKYNHYTWVTTHGVDEEVILNSLPTDLQREIKRYLFLDLVRTVPLFNEMDEKMQDVICDRLKPSYCTRGNWLVREGDPVSKMHLIIRGYLDSCTTNGNRTGFLNSAVIGPKDFCGEELLTWALDPRPNVILPSSTRTLKALTEVEAFAISADDLKFVASQFRRLHSKQLRHTLRFYSHQWRTWAACFIGAAWQRYKKRKDASEHRAMDGCIFYVPDQATKQNGADLAVDNMKLAASARRFGSIRSGSNFGNISALQKPVDHVFTEEEG